MNCLNPESQQLQRWEYVKWVCQHIADRIPWWIRITVASPFALLYFATMFLLFFASIVICEVLSLVLSVVVALVNVITFSSDDAEKHLATQLGELKNWRK